ncbi:MAG: 50S ribosomal protein L10 [Desulfobacterales bacterium]|nr:50S ribosomal protein L10 [Desulfobacterales bacterium]
MKKDQKNKIVEELREKFSRSKVVIVTDFKGLDVEKISDLRRKLRESEIEYKVVKNTLLVRASEGTDIAVIRGSFKGPSAVALSYNDPVASAKILTQYAAKEDKLKIKSGVLNGKALDWNAIKALSDLPSREVLLGQLLSAMNGVPVAFLRALNDIPVRFLNVLGAIARQKEAVG